MSIATDLRSYADSAVNQGRQVLDSSINTAQGQLNDVTGQANEFYGKTKENVAEITEKAAAAVNDLRAQAEKAVNLDAIKTAVEPYLQQVKGYTHQVSDRAELLFDNVKTDPRVAKVVDAAEVLVATVQERVVKPVQSLTGLGAPTPTAKPAPKAAAKPATKPAATKPATAKPATKPAARKAPAKRTPAS